MSELRAKMADAAASEVPGEAEKADTSIQATGHMEPLEDITYTDPIEDIDMVPVVVALIRVMRDVKSIDKKSTASIRTEKGSYSFNYRGSDKVLNAVGPALRRHGVLIIPHRIEASYSSPSRMRECTVNIQYRAYGPLGDWIEMAGAGEGLDVGERGTAKALTTAYRSLLTTALTVPTEDPKLDPDVVNVVRQEPQPRKPSEYYADITSPTTSVDKLRSIRQELNDHPSVGSVIVDHDGEEISLIKLVVKIGFERTSQANGGQA